MAKRFYVVAATTPPSADVPLAAGTVVYSVNSRNAFLAIRLVARHLAALEDGTDGNVREEGPS